MNFIKPKMTPRGTIKVLKKLED